MKLLVCIPSYTNAGSLRECLTPLVLKGADIIALDNGASVEVKEILNEYSVNYEVKLWHNPANELVNKPWNDFMKYFLSQEQYSHLIIMNDDLMLNSDWYEVVCKRWLVDPNEVLLPTIVNREHLYVGSGDTSIQEAQVVDCCTAGVFITMNRAQAQACYPIPAEEIRLWFGDDFLFGIMRGIGYKTVVVPNLKAVHGNSVTVGSLPGKAAIIEQDKVKWRDHVEPLMQNRIKQLKNERLLD